MQRSTNTSAKWVKKSTATLRQKNPLAPSPKPLLAKESSTFVMMDIKNGIANCLDMTLQVDSLPYTIYQIT